MTYADDLMHDALTRALTGEIVGNPDSVVVVLDATDADHLAELIRPLIDAAVEGASSVAHTIARAGRTQREHLADYANRVEHEPVKLRGAIIAEHLRMILAGTEPWTPLADDDPASP